MDNFGQLLSICSKKQQDPFIKSKKKGKSYLKMKTT